MSVRALTTLLLGIWTLALAGGADAGQSERALLAVVNADSIFTTDVDAIFAGVHSGMSASQKGDFDYHKLLKKLINDRLIIQEAEALGIPSEDYFREFLDEQKRGLVSRLYVRKNLPAIDSIGADSIAAYFRGNYRKVRVRTIAVATAAAAESLVALVKAGADMDSLAKARSLDVHRYMGGLHSFKYWANIELDLRDYLQGATKGQLIGPFPFRQVSAIMRVEDTAPANPEELPALRGMIKEALRAQSAEAAWKRFVGNLRDRYSVVIDSAAIAAIVENTTSVLDSTFQYGSERPVAVMAGQVIADESRLRRATAHAAMSNATAPVATLLYQTLDGLLQEAVLYRAGLDAGLDADERIVRQLAVASDSALIEIYLKETVVAAIKFNRDEFQQYYREHQADFRDPDQINIREVTVASAATADSAVALLHEGADFGYVAGRFRKDPKELAERVQWISLAAFPPSIRADLEQIKVGGNSQAYPTEDGWVIFKLLDRRQGELRRMDEVEMKIREAMFQAKFTELLDAALERLRAHSTIVLFDEAIENYLGAGN